jgi:Asp-tRNA(Asn)/Glu-tRNA(Gln) amidotransferase A subunit family amidase
LRVRNDAPLPTLLNEKKMSAKDKPDETSEKPVVLPFLAATEKFRTGADTPRRFLDRSLAALDHWEPKIAAFVALNIEGARAAADRSTARWAAGKPASPIDGMPVAIKDIIETADMPTQFGSPLFEGWQSRKDSASVAALRAAGAIILGKTVTTEFAMAYPFGKTRNPHDTNRTPGGSSSGSAAAVGAGIVTAALGTQVIGSGLRPASYCGAFGFKPSVHGINRTGSHDPQSQSCTVVIAATLEDTWQVAHEIVERAGGDPGFPGIVGPDRLPAAKKPRRLAILETAAWASATDEAKQQFATAVSRIKAAGIEIIDRRTHAIVDAVEADIADAMNLSMTFSDWEMRLFIRTLADRDIEKLSQPVRDRFKVADALTLEDYRAALVTRDGIREGYNELAADCDGCITLSASGAAPVGIASTGSPLFAVPGSLLGTPALSLPVLQAEGLPLGLQFIGFVDRDAEAFASSAWLYDLLAK